jgi:hypothetical protein
MVIGIKALMSHDEERDLDCLRRLEFEVFRVLGFLGIESGWLPHR